MADTLKKMKIVIIVLAVLLGLCLAALAGVIIYGQLTPSSGSAVVPDNYIDPASDNQFSTVAAGDFRGEPILLCAPVANVNLTRSIPMIALAKTIVDTARVNDTVISIYKNNPEDSTPFYLPNMFPGDSETKAYLIEVSHRGTVTVRFHADIRAGYEKLAEVLKCKIVLRGENKTLYDGLMRDMPASVNHRITSATSTTTDLTYDITVYLETSVGNEYMNKELVADFRWWVEDCGDKPTPTPGQGGGTTEPETPTPTPDPGKPTPTPGQGGGTTEPETPTPTPEPGKPTPTPGQGGTVEPGKPTPTPGQGGTVEPGKPTPTPGQGGTVEPGKPTPTPGQGGTVEPGKPTPTPGQGGTVEPGKPTPTPAGPDDGELVTPPTGDSSHFCIWFWIAMGSLLVNIMLLWLKRRKNNGKQEAMKSNEQ